ncbi:ABC transporter permease [Flavisolibacter nicotianae]|uniref:ABC transporter permease n=1 Tax=Flavisolibacter nicotianae TaxID=2364882 RepID=UPI000EB417BB|nr:FtsX-like permease family protein [Flavisolibacter nicotianae]
MKKKLSFDIAKALLLARLKQTLVAAIGVTFSITMFITLLSFMTGLNKLLDNLIINRTPHVRLFNEIQQNPNQPITLVPQYKGAHHFISSIKTANSREELYNSSAILRTLRADSRVQGISQKINTPAFFNEGNTRIAATINGIDVQSENSLFHFFDYITKGVAENLGIIPNSIVPGKALADKLAVDIGDMVYVTMPTGETFPLKVVAFYQSGINDLDKVIAFTSIATAQKLLGKPANYLTEVQVRLNDIAIAPAVAKEYRHLFGIQAEDIQTANAQFETGTSIRTLISYVVGITLLIVAGFGIYNILNMMIYEKMDTIAILKATGFSGRDVKQIFMLIALSIGFFGGLAGLLFGYGLSVIIDNIPFNTAALPTIKTYPVNYNPVYYMIGILFSLLTTYLAGYFPAAKAGRIDPVVIIRGK